MLSTMTVEKSDPLMNSLRLLWRICVRVTNQRSLDQESPRAGDPLASKNLDCRVDDGTMSVVNLPLLALNSRSASPNGLDSFRRAGRYDYSHAG